MKIGKRSFSVEQITVAVSVSFLGVSWFIVWLYFLFTRFITFMAQPKAILLWHMFIQLLASLSLVLTGLAIFYKWKKFKAIFLTSIVLLIIGTGSAILIYGPNSQGDPIFMYLFGLWTLVVGSVLTTAVYLRDRMVHDWERKL